MRKRNRNPVGASAGRSGLRGLLAAGIFAVALASGADRGEAYRLLDNGAADRVVASENAIRWAPGVWAPGATLSWQVADAPQWGTIFGSRRGIESAVEQGLSKWSDIETADIRWSVSGSGGPAVSTWTRDASNQVFFNSSGPDFESGAGLWFERDSSGRAWNISECDVGAPAHWINQFGGFDFDSAIGTAALELGNWFAYCLGLDPSATMPWSETLRQYDDEDLSRSVFHLSPWEREQDRRIGASLLRPRSGWLSTVGSVAGTLVSDGEPVSYAHVWAFRANGGSEVSQPVGAFSDRLGAFTIEGLTPGDYVLWAHPIAAWNHRLGAVGASTGVKDAILAHPVRVTGGGVARGNRITMQGNR